MLVKCKYCFENFEAQRSTATFCSDTHRTLFGKLSNDEKVQKEKELTDLIKTSDENLKKLRVVMADINKDFGEGTVMMLGDKPQLQNNVISTGSISLDMATGVGGAPRGRIIEIYGHNGSGKTTLAIYLMKNAQQKGIRCLLVDAENTFDPDYATNLGLNVKDLIYCQPEYAEQALETVDRYISSGLVGMAVIDSVAALVPKGELEGEMGDSKMGLMARLMSQACRKMTASIAKSNSICLFINQLRSSIGNIYQPFVTTGGNALGFYASLRLEVIKLAQIKDGEVSVGNKTKVKVVKNKCAPPFKTAEFDIVFGDGIDRVGEIIDIAESQKIIQRSGAWYSYNTIKIGQGRENVKSLFADNPELYQEIEKKVLYALSKD